MANMEHVQLARRGRDTVARWREEHPNEILDLNAAYMSYARMPQANLSGADLRNSDLTGAMLQRANLSGCYLNPAHMYHANLIQADLSRALMNGANLRGANFTGANLTGVDLDRATLSDANLTGADLSGANLARVNLAGANLTDANLTGANLNRAILTRTNLTNATLGGADFYEAVFHNSVLTGSDFSGSIVGYTVFQNCDVSESQGLDQVRHDAPSTIGVDTLYRSGGNISAEFLHGAGVADSLIEFQAAIQGTPTIQGDCFISCSAKDHAFARELQSELRSRSVRCWLFPEDARGSALVDRRSTSDQEEVERWVRAYDKLVVVCSQAALDSETVRNDINGAKDAQFSRDQWVLYLVAPDETVVQPRGRGLARNLNDEHVVFDLRDQGSESYLESLDRLAGNLKETQAASAGRPVIQVSGDPNQL
jgi:uncharacterized protein YjbI with pentapeptide repeats